MSTQSVVRHRVWQHTARWLQLLAERRRRSDGLLQSAATWEAQYAAGRWDFLAQLSELSRFSILAGYISYLKPGGVVLEAGCGQGSLLSRLPSSSYARYVGIDVSSSAISVAQTQQNERSTFIVADCEDYTPAGQFDVIVFNEVLVCLRDPLRTVERYARSLSSGGLILVSNCTAAHGSAAILRRLKRVFATVDEVRVVHGGRNVSWVCTALRHRGIEPIAPIGATYDVI